MNLEFKNVIENKNLVPSSVLEFILKNDINQEIKVAEINPKYADGEALSKNYGIPYEMELNCLVVKGSRGEENHYAAILVPYGKRANMNAKVRNPMNVKKVSFADLNYVVETTGMEFGSITPIGLPEDWMILVDSSVLEQEQVIVGGGFVQSKLILPSKLFSSFPNCQIVEGLAKE